MKGVICYECGKITIGKRYRGLIKCKECKFKTCVKCNVSLPWNRPKWKSRCLPCYIKHKQNDNRKCRITFSDSD